MTLMLQPKSIFFLNLINNSCKFFKREFKGISLRNNYMEKNNTKKQNVYISEEEKTLVWEDIQNSFKKTFGNEIYNSWLQKISLVKEYNDYLILGVPTRFLEIG